MAEGLSPLARGKRHLHPERQGQQGPIPAGAGETRARSSSASASRAYPRWRGGNRHGELRVAGIQGLSPLARGKLRAGLLLRRWQGPIPAGAGETRVVLDGDGPIWAYPRWRGGNIHRSLSDIQGQGLSPLARGKPTDL